MTQRAVTILVGRSVAEVGERRDRFQQAASRPEESAGEEAPVSGRIGRGDEAGREVRQKLGIAEQMACDRLVERLCTQQRQIIMLGEGANDVANQHLTGNHPVISELAPFGGIARSALLGVELSDQFVTTLGQQGQQLKKRADIPTAIGDFDDLSLTRQPIQRGKHGFVERDAVGHENIDRRTSRSDLVDQLDRDLGIEEMEDKCCLHRVPLVAAIRRAICRA